MKRATVNLIDGSVLSVSVTILICWCADVPHPVIIGAVFWCALGLMIWTVSVVFWLLIDSRPYWAARRQRLDFPRVRVHRQRKVEM